MKEGKPISRQLITVEEMNEILKKVKQKDVIIMNQKRQKTLKGFTFIKNNHVGFQIDTCVNGRREIFYTYKDGREIYKGLLEGTEAFAVLNQYYKVPEAENNDKLKEKLSAVPILGYNPKYEKEWGYAYEYDINSAYSYQMSNGWIDTAAGPKIGIIGEDEIGFTDDLSFIRKTGEFSLYVFKKIESPVGIKKFVDVWYNRKKNAINDFEKVKAKTILNHSVGCLQNRNLWLRAYIVASCNTFIRDNLDENSLLWNTDCIISKTPRPDLEKMLGAELGKMKKIEGNFAYIGLSYQWKGEKATYRGVVKAEMPDDYDLIYNNKLDVGLIKYKFNEETLQLEENKNGIK